MPVSPTGPNAKKVATAFSSNVSASNFATQLKPNLEVPSASEIYTGLASNTNSAVAGSFADTNSTFGDTTIGQNQTANNGLGDLIATEQWSTPSSADALPLMVNVIVRQYYDYGNTGNNFRTNFASVATVGTVLAAVPEPTSGVGACVDGPLRPDSPPCSRLKRFVCERNERRLERNLKPPSFFCKARHDSKIGTVAVAATAWFGASCDSERRIISPTNSLVSRWGWRGQVSVVAGGRLGQSCRGDEWRLCRYWRRRLGLSAGPWRALTLTVSLVYPTFDFDFGFSNSFNVSIYAKTDQVRRARGQAMAASLASSLTF